MANLTLLRARKNTGKTLTKVEDGYTVSVAGNLWLFDAIKHEVDGVDSLVKVLKSASTRPNLVAIMDDLKEGVSPRGFLRRGINFDRGVKPFIFLDLDKLPFAEPDITLAGDMARSLLPPEFHGARCGVQATSQHMISAIGKNGLPKPIRSRLRLYFYLDEGVTPAQASQWAERASTKIDASLFASVHVTYLAGPTFLGCNDPFPERWVMLDGAAHVIVPIDLDAVAATVQDRLRVAPEGVPENSSRAVADFIALIDREFDAKVTRGRRNLFRNWANDAFDRNINESLVEALLIGAIAGDDIDAKDALEQELRDLKIESPALAADRIHQFAARTADRWEEGDGIDLEDAIRRGIDEAPGYRHSPFGCWFNTISDGSEFGSTDLGSSMTEQEKTPPAHVIEGREKIKNIREGNFDLDAHGGDIVNARLFAGECQTRVRYLTDRQEWIAFDGRRWNGGGGAASAMGEIKAFAESRMRLAVQAKAKGDDSGFKKALALFSSAGKLEAALKLAQTEVGVSEVSTAFDANPWVLGVQNGVLDLRTGLLDAPGPQHKITKLAGASFVPGAACPEFLTFLERVMPDADTRRYIQKYIGYTLTGLVTEEKAIFLHGPGANGKTTLANVARKLLGDYAVTLPVDVVLHRSNSSEGSRAILKLPGSRMAILNETPAGARWNDQAFKSLVSNEPMNARLLYKEAFDFMPTHKMWMVGNYLPSASDPGDGFWRRLSTMLFGYVIPEAERRQGLDDELFQKEGSGILNWALAGLRDWRATRLEASALMAADTGSYRRSTDVLGSWLEERTTCDTHARTPSRDLYASYTSFCVENGSRGWASNSFGRDMVRRGFEPQKSNGVRLLKGLRLGDDADMELPAAG